MFVDFARALGRVARVVSYASAALAAIVLVSMTAFILIEIALRETIGVSSNVMVEFVGYGLAAMTMLGAADTAREGGLIRMNLLLYFVAPWGRRLIDGFCVICAIAMVSFFTWFVYLDMHRSFVREYMTDSLVSIPSWLPPLPMFCGLLAFLFQLFSILLLVLADQGAVVDAVEEI